MKYKSSILWILIGSTTLLSCAKNNGATDSIHIAKKIFSINKNMQTVLVNTIGTKWWIGSVMKNATYLNLQPQITGIILTDCKEKLADSTIEIQRSNCDTMLIKLNENKTNAFRKFNVILEDGDYFDYITITQGK